MNNLMLINNLNLYSQICFWTNIDNNTIINNLLQFFMKKCEIII